MNMTDNSSEHTKPPADEGLSLFAKITITLQIIIMVVVVVGNLLVLTAVLYFRTLRDITGIFVANLALADLITGISLPFQITFFFFPEMEQSKFACILRFSIISFVCNASLLSLVCTVIDRYIAIVYPLTYGQLLTNRTAYIMVVCIWIVDIMFSLIPLVGANNWEMVPSCLYELVINKYFRMANSCIGLFFAAFMLSIYIKILLIVRKHIQQIQSENIQQSGNGDASARRTTQMNKVVAMVVLFFHISWLPFFCIQLTMLEFENVTKAKVMAANFLVFLGIMNSMVNPVIYAWKNKQYRRAFQKLLCLQPGDREDFINSTFA